MSDKTPKDIFLRSDHASKFSRENRDYENVNCSEDRIINIALYIYDDVCLNETIIESDRINE